MVIEQFHEEFKTFASPSFEDLSKAIAEFAETEKVAVKSVSVLDGGQDWLVSIGYRRGEESYPVSLQTAKLVDMPSVDELSLIDDALARAQAGYGRQVLCHSLYMTDLFQVAVMFLIHG